MERSTGQLLHTLVCTVAETAGYSERVAVAHVVYESPGFRSVSETSNQECGGGLNT